MRTMLIPFCDDDLAEAALNTALILAARNNGHIEGLHAWRTPQVIAGEGVVFPSESLSRMAEEGQQFANRARDRFNRIVKDKGVEFRDVDSGDEAITCGWREGEGIEAEIVGDYGRLFDLIVMGRSVNATTSDWKTTVEAALFESGRPVLIAGPQADADVGSKIVIGWNGATETARTIAATMPFLIQADEVCVLTIQGGTVVGPSGEQVAQHLRRNGAKASASTRDADGRSVGEAMIAGCKEHGANLLVKGAFTNSRLRQMIFGGATRDIIEKSDVATILAH
jgi:nucleotide-binding universal stress UspA family protein